MFPQISRRIALQFTTIVFVLLLVNGLLFLIADLSNEQRLARSRLIRTAEAVSHEAQIALGGGRAQLPRMLRDNIRIIRPDGTALHAGEFFNEMPFAPEEGIRNVVLDGDHYHVMTLALREPDRPQGFVQVAALERMAVADIPLRAGLYLIVSTAVLALVFGVGRFFARRSLRPAEDAMQQLEQFTQDASHELRTPLTALSSSLDLALKTGKYKEGIESAKEDLHRTSDLLDRLLQIARLGTAGVERAPVDVSAVVAHVVERFQPMAKERGVVLTSSVASGVTVQGDEALIRQILQNLIQNAIKFSKERTGTITVSLTRDALSVQDTGVGIDAAALPHIFDRFYQQDASRSHGGHGLGLALVKRIVELHGWSIGVESSEGKGTRFLVRFAAKA